MSSSFQPHYLSRLPLPLAQLYRRTNNAKSPQARHNYCFYTFEAIIKLTAAPAIAFYLQEVTRDPGRRVPKLDRLLEKLALPSLGHWVAMLRELARHIGSRPDKDTHALGHLWNALNQRHRNAGLLNLYRYTKKGVDSQDQTPSNDQSCSLLQLIDSLVQYRNAVFGHGGQRAESHFQRWGEFLLPAVNEVLSEDILSVLWPKDARLVFISEVTKESNDLYSMAYKDLTGEAGIARERMPLAADHAEGLSSGMVALIIAGHKTPLSLAPLLLYQEGDFIDQVLFLNRDRSGRQVEFLGYTSGDTLRDETTVEPMRRLMQLVTGREVTQSDLGRLMEKSQSDFASFETIEATVTPQRRIVGDFEILAKLGQGGMGVVYLARQLSLGRLVAIKMLPDTLRSDELAIARFRREIKILALCDHPNLVKIITSGETDDGIPFYVMEHVPGCDLGELYLSAKTHSNESTSGLSSQDFADALLAASERHRQAAIQGCEPTISDTAEQRESAVADAVADRDLDLPPLAGIRFSRDERGGYVRQVVKAIRDAARAAHYLHAERSIIHRDIKPGNIMLATDGSSLRVVLMDLGLAKAKDSDFTQTHSTDFLGTLRYAAPEQLAAAMLDVGPQADVRALGVTLWELLTRERLFEEAQDPGQLASLIHGRDVPLLTGKDHRIDKDLETIVAHATAIRIDDRIQTAGELADYLELYLQGKELPIAPWPPLKQLARWAQRNKPLAALAGTLVAAVLIGSIGMSLLAVIAKQNADAAERNADIAQSQAEQRQRAFQIGLESTDRAFEIVSTDPAFEHLEFQQVKNQLIENGESYYRAVMEDLTADQSPSARQRIAAASYMQGRLALRNGQDPLPHFERAHTLQQSLLDTEGVDQDEVLRDLSRTVNAMGEVSDRAASDAASVRDTATAVDRYQRAIGLYNKATTLRERLSQDDVENVRLLANSYMNVAQARLDLATIEGRDDAENIGAVLQRAIDAREAVAVALRSKALQRDIGKGYLNRGKFRAQQRLSVDAIRDYQQAATHFSELLSAAPNHAELLSLLGDSLRLQGELYASMGQLEAAKSPLMKSERVFRKHSFSNLVAQRNLAISQMNVGYLHIDSQPALAGRKYRSAWEIYGLVSQIESERGQDPSKSVTNYMFCLEQLSRLLADDEELRAELIEQAAATLTQLRAFELPHPGWTTVLEASETQLKRIQSEVSDGSG